MWNTPFAPNCPVRCAGGSAAGRVSREESSWTTRTTEAERSLRACGTSGPHGASGTPHRSQDPGSVRCGAIVQGPVRSGTAVHRMGRHGGQCFADDRCARSADGSTGRWRRNDRRVMVPCGRRATRPSQRRTRAPVKLHRAWTAASDDPSCGAPSEGIEQATPMVAPPGGSLGPAHRVGLGACGRGWPLRCDRRTGRQVISDRAVVATRGRLEIHRSLRRRGDRGEHTVVRARSGTLRRRGLCAV